MFGIKRYFHICRGKLFSCHNIKDAYTVHDDTVLFWLYLLFRRYVRKRLIEIKMAVLVFFCFRHSELSTSNPSYCQDTISHWLLLIYLGKKTKSEKNIYHHAISFETCFLKLFNKTEDTWHFLLFGPCHHIIIFIHIQHQPQRHQL